MHYLKYKKIAMPQIQLLQKLRKIIWKFVRVED